MDTPTAADDPGAERKVPLHEAMTMAIAFQRRGQLAAAEEVYRKVLELVPDHAEALHFSGVLAHQQGRSDEAVALVRRSLELVPDRADWQSNLGIILKGQGRVDEAVDAYQRAIALDPAHANAHSNLGVLYKAQGRPVEAEAAYRTAIEIDPGHIDAYHNLGVLLASVRRVKEAVWCYCKVTTLSPRHPEARRLLVLAHSTLGERDKAVAVAQEWVDLEPDNLIARYTLQSCSGDDPPARTPDAYVERVFDAFAETFDAKLSQLSYRAPQLVAAMLEDSGAIPSKSLDVLDAGCGTGLCGQFLAPYARRLVGVDLSARMLDQARARGGYDELVKGELTAYLGQAANAFDLIVSADTLVYFGALDDVLSAAAAALRPRGMLIFSLEEETDAGVTAPYRIHPHGRYSHRQDYVERLLAGAGLRAEIVHAELRMESGVPVAGLVVRATRTDRPRDAGAGEVTRG